MFQFPLIPCCDADGPVLLDSFESFCLRRVADQPSATLLEFPPHGRLNGTINIYPRLLLESGKSGYEWSNKAGHPVMSRCNIGCQSEVPSEWGFCEPVNPFYVILTHTPFSTHGLLSHSVNVSLCFAFFLFFMLKCACHAKASEVAWEDMEQ